ncbi:unnamed protein product [Spirodela intermedia]|uniref:Bidirectional sugar transporter SWEET n=1 Tax=Spirodela intermedia TaxID=51605 RepID=A0A7I8JQL1_SPIIN|nr:unnamed protein product [Spirodela intermedia]CAA6672075.1 unnamed protein product [Spirodela intermedia]
MVSADAARNIVGIIGNVISFGLFLSPVPTFYKIWRRKAVEDFSPIPYLATFLNCMMWIFYGIPVVHPHSLLVVTINGTGLALETIYLIIFLLYSTPSRRCRVLKYITAELAFMAAVVVGVLMGAHTHEKRSLIVGVMCVIFGTCMYASPLAAMRNVVKTRSVKYMPFWLSLASFLNGICWTLYALIRFDIFITIPNGLGALFGAAQLVLYVCYCGSTPRDEPKAEIQLPTVTGAAHNDGGVSSISVQ